MRHNPDVVHGMEDEKMRDRSGMGNLLSIKPSLCSFCIFSLEDIPEKQTFVRTVIYQFSLIILMLKRICRRN